jgi:hypothetical protein
MPMNNDDDVSVRRNVSIDRREEAVVRLIPWIPKKPLANGGKRCRNHVRGTHPLVAELIPKVAKYRVGKKRIGDPPR